MIHTHTHTHVYRTVVGMVNDPVGTIIASTEIGVDDRHERQRLAAVWRCGGGTHPQPVHRRHDANQCGYFDLGAAFTSGVACLAVATTACGSSLV